jgi:hypothetical protein
MQGGTIGLRSVGFGESLSAWAWLRLGSAMAHLRPSGERTFFFDWERSKHPHVKSTIDFGSAGTSPNAVSKRKIMQPKKNTQK